MPGYQSKKIFSLEISRENRRIKISAYERLSDDEKTIRHYEFKDICDDDLNKMCASVVELLNSTNQNGKINTQTLKELQSAGQLLYDSLLTVNVKKKLTATDAENLIISIDDHLVQIPWEIMFDGSSFLCQRFNMGRVVSTGQRTSDPAVRTIAKPMKMLVIADPRGDLEASYREGVRLRDTLDHSQDTVEVHLRSSTVDVEFLKGTLRDYDVLHYAGHADYDIANPSDSGFLMQDGRLKASDIINMIGPSPLPSLVFSNACKSGHTDMWKVGEDYETEIYGLANAFLLAGVQHYIGTFWDVQDEPSLYFSIDFYKELIDGAMVGEAVRKARLRLIERYGEDTVIWASYMLYGDPTARYVALSKYEDRDDGIDVSDADLSGREEEKVLRGSVSSAGKVVSFPGNKQRWILLSAAVLLALTAIMTFQVFRKGEHAPPVHTPVVVSTESVEAKEKRVNELVASLIRQYKEDKASGAGHIREEHRSGLPALVFLNINAYGITKADKDYILARVTDALQKSNRVHVVDRGIIDKLLKELKMSSSQLADPETTLRIGRILSANLISVGSIVRDNNDWQVSLRMIETETTSVKAALAEDVETGDKKEVARVLGHEILKKIRAVYPLQGRILSYKEESVVLDVGYKDGAETGLKMNVLSETGKINVGELEITSVAEHTSDAKILSQRGNLGKGLRVEEFL